MINAKNRTGNQAKIDLEEYQAWLNSPDHTDYLTLLKQSAEARWLSEEPPLPAGFNKGPGMEGFYVEGEDDYDYEHYRFLLEYLKEKMSTLTYRFYTAMDDTSVKYSAEVRKESYYFKPNIRIKELPQPQEYGNVLLELESHDGNAKYLKILATSYTGFNYVPPKDFKDLIRHLLKP